MTKTQQSERDEAVANLRETLKPGDKVVTILRGVSRSGMNRKIDVYKLRPDGKGGVDRLRLSWWIGKATSFTYDRKSEALSIGGCGMDMGFHVVYELSRALWPDGFECAGDACRSNDHTNGDRNRKPHHHNDGGYALVQEWM